MGCFFDGARGLNLDAFLGRAAVFDIEWQRAMQAEIMVPFGGVSMVTRSLRLQKLFLEGFGLIDFLEKKLIGHLQTTKQAITASSLKEGMLRVENLDRWVICTAGLLCIYDTKRTAGQQKLALVETIRLHGCIVKASKEQPRFFKVSFPRRTIYFGAGSSDQMAEWITFIIMQSPASSNPFSSFAPIRRDISPKYYVDGCQYFPAVAKALRKATREIFISDWSLNPELYLVRTSGASPEDRLDYILQEKAEQGVKVYVLLWRETTIAMGPTINSTHAAQRLSALHPSNVIVMRHAAPGQFPFWSHHSKMVVVDQCLAFIGGLDLCFGRYDDRDHPLKDDCHLRTKFPGKDYYNPSITDFKGLEEPFTDLIDRTQVPRMGWHDVGVRLNGACAQDISWYFIQRWNHHRLGQGPSVVMPYLHAEIGGAPLAQDSMLTPPSSDGLARSKKKGSCVCQVLRSASSWSGHSSTEKSIYTAYVHLIETAKHCIYIENQYFISNAGSQATELQNRIAEALFLRIKLAYESKQSFRVIIVLPLHPAGGSWKDSSAIRYLMKFQFDTLCRGPASLFEKLKMLGMSTLVLNQFVSVFALKRWTKVGKQLKAEQIYVHSKVMLVDDEAAIIGSANINDRSMLGDRDSEVAVLIRDSEYIPSKMNGAFYLSGKFVRSLRMDLWSEHLGLSHEEQAHLQDPGIQSTMDFWLTRADTNRRIYAHALPEDNWGAFHSVAQINDAKALLASLRPDAEKESYLDKIRGTVIPFPLNFLQNENLSPVLEGFVSSVFH